MEGTSILPRGHASAQPSSRAAACGSFVLMGAILIGPAIWNRFPLLQYDTGGYLARWFEGYLVPSRPGAYGLLLAATAPLEFWPVLVLQAAVTIWVLALLLKELGLDPQQPFQMHELLTNARYLWHGAKNYVQLDPASVPAQIFRVRHRLRREQDFDYFL